MIKLNSLIRLYNSLGSHENNLIKNLASVAIPDNTPRCLKRKLCQDL